MRRGRTGRWGWRGLLSAAGAIVHLLLWGTQQLRAETVPRLYWREISAGGEISERSWSAYTTSTIAPMGWLDQDGPRLRATGGYGRYSYTGALTQHHGISTFSEVLIGYQLGFGAATIKGFAGAAGIGHAITPFDADNSVRGAEVGFKGVLETWLNLGSQAWVSLDGSWTSAFGTYSSRLRGGWRIMPELSAGVEAGALGNASFDGGRGGLFLRWEQGWGEVSISGGATGTLDRPDTPYGTVSLLVRY